MEHFEENCIGIVTRPIQYFYVVQRGAFLSGFYGAEVAIEKWFGSWGQDIYTGFFFHEEELEK